MKLVAHKQQLLVNSIFEVVIKFKTIIRATLFLLASILVQGQYIPHFFNRQRVSQSMQLGS